jgi:hypothetical protein
VIGSRGQAVLARLIDPNDDKKTVRDAMRMELLKGVQMIHNLGSQEKSESRGERLSNFLFGTDRGRAIVVACILITLLLLGTFATMICEGWTFVEGFYFASYGLLTVGHGDVVPVTNAGIWFVDFWIPFSVLFVTLYLGSVSHIFVRAHNWNADRIERMMRDAAKLAPAPGDGAERNHGADNPQRRTRIRQNSAQKPFDHDGVKIVTVRDLLRKIHQPKPSDANTVPLAMHGPAGGDGATVVFSPYYQSLMQNANTDDDFVIRLRVLDRVARIVSAQLLVFDSSLEVDGESLRITVDSLKDWTTVWKIPRQARASYREIAFEALLFVGEQQIFDHGVGAFFDLTIVEFLELFSPFVFALEGTQTMQDWLKITDEIARERLPCGMEDFEQDAEMMQPKEPRRVVKNTIENFFPVNPGNAIRIKI